MAPGDQGEITLLLNRLRTGEAEAGPKLMELVYPELRRLAEVYMSREHPGHTLQPTALVHELFLRIGGSNSQAWTNRAHFFAVAAFLMRQILVDHARRAHASKRPNRAHRAPLDDNIAQGFTDLDTILEVDEALGRLEQLDSRQARIVEMRCFAGLTETEIGEVLRLSPRTVKRDWAMAKAWLNGFLSRQPA